MSIRYAILGLLSEQPMHGYRLKEAFDERVSPLWRLTTSQIYQCLSALERTGLLQGRGERAGRRPARRVYSLTERGKRELRKWLELTPITPTVSNRPFREEILIRMMLLRDSDVSSLSEFLDRQEREATLLLARLTHLRNPEPTTPSEVDVRGLFLDGMTRHLEADIKILQRCREEIARCSRADAGQRDREAKPALQVRRNSN